MSASNVSIQASMTLDQSIDERLMERYALNTTHLPRGILPNHWEQSLVDHYSETSQHFDNLQSEVRFLRMALLRSRDTINSLAARVTALENP